jgi:hypothetical protein
MAGRPPRASPGRARRHGRQAACACPNICRSAAASRSGAGRIAENKEEVAVIEPARAISCAKTKAKHARTAGTRKSPGSFQLRSSLNFRRLSTISAQGGRRGRATSARSTLTPNFPYLPSCAAHCGSRPGARASLFGCCRPCAPLRCIRPVVGRGFEGLSFDGA